MNASMEAWTPRLGALCARLRAAARASVSEALAAGDLARIARPVKEGVGDTTFGLDEATEVVLDDWLAEVACEEPLSLLSEDQGWRHRGPDGRGGVRALAGFDHGGPRIAVDPVDGTRNLMADLRSAWVIVSCAPPGAGVPRMRDLVLGLASEIPDSRGKAYRELVGARGRGCEFAQLELASGRELERRRLAPSHDDRCDHGYFPFCHYLPAERPAIARVEAEFFARLARHERADVRTCYDDQYIASGGQLALLALGTYRMIADIRHLAATRAGRTTMTSKPYDLAGAVVCAREAGCIVTAPDGSELDFPIDCETPVDFVGFANEPTRARLWPHLSAAIGAGVPASR